MRCQDCGRPAVYEAQSHGVKVGLCEEHLRQRMATLSDAAALEALVPTGTEDTIQN